MKIFDYLQIDDLKEALSKLFDNGGNFDTLDKDEEKIINSFFDSDFIPCSYECANMAARGTNISFNAFAIEWLLSNRRFTKKETNTLKNWVAQQREEINLQDPKLAPKLVGKIRDLPKGQPTEDPTTPSTPDMPPAKELPDTEGDDTVKNLKKENAELLAKLDKLTQITNSAEKENQVLKQKIEALQDKGVDSLDLSIDSVTNIAKQEIASYGEARKNSKQLLKEVESGKGAIVDLKAKAATVDDNDILTMVSSLNSHFDQNILTMAASMDKTLANNEKTFTKEIVGLYKELERLKVAATTDELTGLRNRRALEDWLEKTLPKLKKSGESLCLLMMDIDFFKKINDTYGHLVGDDALRKVGSAIAKAFRAKEGMLCRYGGEEFAVFVQGMDTASVLEKAQSLRISIENSKFRVRSSGDLVAFTISMGLSKFKPDDDRDSFMARADAALYEAKETGRNKIVANDP